MSRAVWSGSLSIGLINLPVKLYKAVKEDGISFNNLCGFCGSKISLKRWCSNCNTEIPYENVKKGYKVSKSSNYVVIDKEDIEKLKLKSEKVIELKGFVRITDIDSMFITNQKYYVIPQNSSKAYNLLEKVLSLNGLVGIGKLTLRNKEILVALRSFKGYLVLIGLNYFNEIEDVPKDVYEKEEIEIDKNMLNTALKIFENLMIDFNSLSSERDRYSQSLIELVKAKMQNKEFSLIESIEKESKEDINVQLEKMLAIVKKKKK